MPFVVLSHTADTGVEATADSFPELVAELATAMFALMAAVDESPEGIRVAVSVSSATREDLVVEALSDLLYRFEVEDVVFVEIAVEETQSDFVIAARGVPLADVEIIGPPIKAVTYHDLVVEERPDGWFGRVYFDV